MKLAQFDGLIPRTPATSLPPNAATIAENVDFAYGELRSLKGSFKIRDLAVAAQSVWSEDGLRFYAWAEDVNAVVSPLQSGPGSDWIYYTTTSDFRRAPRSGATIGGSTPALSFRAGVPRPTVALKVSVVHPTVPSAQQASVSPVPPETYNDRLAAAQATLDAKNTASIQQATVTRAYTYTYANGYNEEGVPADAVMVDVKSITQAGVTTYSTVTLEVTFDAPGQYAPVTSARIYRTSDGGVTADYYFAMAVAIGSTKAVDNIKPEALNELLASSDAYPPDPALKGLISVGNGILAAYKGNELWFSDPYRPWSWPPSYMKTFGNAVVGIHTHGTGALVVTAGAPSLISGVSPDAMGEIPLDIPQAGVSKWAMLSINGMAIYASNDGIVGVVGGLANMSLSERYFTREVWQKRYGPGLRAMEFAHYDGKVVVFSKVNAFTPFMLELNEAGGAMTELPGLVAASSLVLVTSDQMYTVSGTALNQFCGGDPAPLHWRSADFVLPRPMTLAAAQVECSGDFTVQFYQGARLGYTKTLTTGSTTFNLPTQAIPGHAGLPPADRWQIDIAGTGTFKWIKAAPSKRELATV